MKSSRWFDDMAIRLKRVPVPAVDVRGGVMRRIQGRTGQRTLPMKRKRIVLATAAAVLLLAVPMASASILPIFWQGMQISIESDGGKNNRIEAFKELVAGHQDARQWMAQGIQKAVATYNAEEAKAAFTYGLLRPEQAALPLEKSVGVKNAVVMDGKPSTDTFTYTFWDEYKKDGQWAVVSQSINLAATDFMNGLSNSHSNTYADGYRQIQLDKDTIAFIAERSHQELTMSVDVWNPQRKEMIGLHISGNVPEETAVRIAKSYLPAK